MLGVVKDFELDDQLLVEQIRRVVEPVEVQTAGSSTTGVIRFINADGELVHARVWLCPTQKRFDEFVQQQAKRLRATVSGDKDGRILSPSDHGRSERSAFLRYHSDVVALGSDEAILNVNLNRTAGWLRQAVTCRSLTVLNMDVVPNAYRDRVVNYAKRQAFAALQPRDNEDTTKAETRRSSGLARMELLQAIAEGLREVSWQTSWPLGERTHYVAEASVDARKGSRLAAMIAQLPVDRGLSGDASSAMVAASLNLRIPETLRPIADDVETLTPQPIGGLMQQLVSSGELHATAQLTRDALFAAAECPDGAFAKLSEWVGATVSGKKSLRTLDVSSIGQLAIWMKQAKTSHDALL